jgi:acetyl coenzyme A synthetase (ADP forming)-like protein
MASYPAEFELDAVLADGDVIQIRPIKSGDADQLIAFHERLSTESRYFRFFRVKETLERKEAEFFANIDYHDRMALVALDDGLIVAVGRYDRIKTEPSVAEVAFVVDDQHQGRGIASELLALLTVHARQTGVSCFRAFVLPENLQMMRVFRNSGYRLSRTLEDGVFTVEFPVDYSRDARTAEDMREKRAVAASLLPVFFPRSVAVIGASTTPGSIGSRLFANLLDSGFTGALFPVNSRAPVVHSVRAYPSVLDIPDPVDLAFIAVPARAVLEVVSECARKGVRGLSVISAGFSETGEEGRKLEAELLALVRGAGMRMVGPNCMGLLNTAPEVKLNGTFAHVYPPRGNIAMSSQSGALGIAILDYARQSDIGISQFVSVGNKADVSGNDLLLAWEDDPSTDVILLYLESFGNPRKFSRIARRIGMTKPIIAVKAGRSGSGSRAASSHTGALASSDVAVNALFEQAGVIRTDTIEEMFAVASLLAHQPLPRGRRVGIVTNAGGPSILAADALEAAGLNLPELSQTTRNRLSEKLPAEASTRNPIDTIASGGPAEYAHCLEVLLDSDEVDAVMVIYVPTTLEGAAEVAGAIRTAADACPAEVPLLAVFMQQATSKLMAGGRRTIPAFRFPEAGALALSKAVRHSEWRARDPGVERAFADIDTTRIRQAIEPAVARLGEEGGWLETVEVEGVLAAAGLPLPRSRLVMSADGAVAAAAELGGPVVLKVVAPSALHKSDVGGVLLSLEGSEVLAEGFRRVWSSVPDPEGVLVQEMVGGGHEVLIGMTEDPNFGPLIVFGMGGVLVELLDDVAFRIHPLTDSEARSMILSIRTSRLLQGYRNLPLGDLNALEEALLRVSALITVIPEMVELDMNPVKVFAPGGGVRPVDARIRVKRLQPERSLELADLPSAHTRRPR